LTYQNRFDTALREYKKGKYLLETRPAQLLPGVSVKNPKQREQQRRIVDKVWGMCEKVIGEMRVSLGTLLKDPTRPVEEQEKIIEYVTSLAFRSTLQGLTSHSS
jgi:exocyst complex component 2